MQTTRKTADALERARIGCSRPRGDGSPCAVHRRQNADRARLARRYGRKPTGLIAAFKSACRGQCGVAILKGEPCEWVVGVGVAHIDCLEAWSRLEGR